MIPITNELLLNNLSDTVEYSDLTFKIDGNRISGLIKEKEALIQALDLIFSTERFVFPIFSHNYGVELDDLFSVNAELFDARLKMRIEEAVFLENRVKSVGEISISREKNKVFVNMELVSIYGEISYGMEY